MKKLFLLLLITSCGSRAVQKTETKETIKVDSTYNHVLSTHLVKDLTTSLNTMTINDLTSWSYEAPTDTIAQRPFWLKAGKDSINVGMLPKGSKLHFNRDLSTKRTDSISTDKSTEARRDSLSASKASEHTKVSKVKDTQREAKIWALMFIAFILGWFAIPIIKFIKNRILW